MKRKYIKGNCHRWLIIIIATLVIFSGAKVISASEIATTITSATQVSNTVEIITPVYQEQTVFATDYIVYDKSKTIVTPCAAITITNKCMEMEQSSTDLTETVEEEVKISYYGDEIVVIDNTKYEPYIYEHHPEDWAENYRYYPGEILDADLGRVMGPTCEETFYNLPMRGVINKMIRRGYVYEYWVREDGVKMYGAYIMLAANLDKYPRGTILKTTLGLGIVCDTGDFAKNNPDQVDIAVTW